MMAGAAPDPKGLARSIQLRAGVALLGEIQRDFLTKSRGGTGRDGITWPPLKPETIARRRSTPAELRGFGIHEGPRPSLSPAEDQLWRRTFVSVYRRARVDLDDREAKARAASVAWATVKRAGAKTKTELLGSRKVDMLRDTGELFRSLTPGIDDVPSGADGQVFEVRPGRVIVGTNKKPWHQDGNAAKNLPARPLWPRSGEVPAAWWPAVNEAVATGLAEAVPKVLGRP